MSPTRLHATGQKEATVEGFADCGSEQHLRTSKPLKSPPVLQAQDPIAAELATDLYMVRGPWIVMNDPCGTYPVVMGDFICFYGIYCIGFDMVLIAVIDYEDGKRPRVRRNFFRLLFPTSPRQNHKIQLCGFPIINATILGYLGKNTLVI
jgi:hypothetical protein